MLRLICPLCDAVQVKSNALTNNWQHPERNRWGIIIISTFSTNNKVRNIHLLLFFWAARFFHLGQEIAVPPSGIIKILVPQFIF